MDIRAYRQDDEDAVVELWSACGLVVPQNNPRLDIARKIEVDPELFLVGVNEIGVVATVMAGYEGHRGWINYLAVAPRVRRQGYGRIMLEAAENRLRSKGCPKINLQIRSSNTQVIDFYRSLGYAVDDVVGMGKRLEHDSH